jgi:peroxiredoxin Q/BCP
MAQLRQDYQMFVDHDTVVIVVGPEEQTAFKKYWAANRLPFIGLPNPDHSVLKQFGQEVNLFKLGRMPAQVLIDRQGMARFVHFGKSMSDIPDNQEILKVIRKLNGEEVLLSE